MKDKAKIIDWSIAILFAISVIVALIMSWFSMTDLATTTFGLPQWIAVIISLAFDIGAIFLALITVSAALRSENATMAKLATLAFIGTSLYINVVHAQVSNYGLVGMIMFGAAPAIVFISFEIYLRHIMKRELREQGLIPDRMPKVGALTWMRHSGPSFRLASKALEARLIKEDKILDSKLAGYEIPQTIKAEAVIEKPAKKITAKPQPAIAPAMSTQEISEPIAPVVTAKEEFKFGFQAPPEFTATKTRGMAIEAYQQGHRDPEQVAEWLGTDKVTVQKHFSAARKLENK